MTKVVFFLLSAAIFFPFSGFAQGNEVKINGRVLDEKTQEPVIGASISLAGSKGTGTVSDARGNFLLTVKSLPATISVNYLGYETQEIDIYEQAGTLTIGLVEDQNLLDEVVVVGYGTQKRKELTGAVASVSPISLSQQAVSFDKLLGGAVAGLTVTQTSGQPGATSTVRIRGSNSLAGKNEPLYVIDGFVLYNDNSATRTGLGGTTSGVGGAGATQGTIDGGLNPLTSINAADIESIEVLKDISATAIYGSRGANGVIIITTRKGKRGVGSVNYSASFGTSQVRKKLNLLSGDEWASLWAETSADGKNPYDASQPYDVNRLVPKGQTTDWQSALFQTGTQQNHQISISGGGNDYRYLISGNYTKQSGTIKATGLERYSGRINVDKDVFKNLNVGSNLTVAHTVQQGLSNLGTEQGSSSTFSYGLRTAPLVPIYDDKNDDGYNYYNPFDASDMRIGDKSVNMISDLLKSTVETRNLSVIGNAYASYTIVPQLVAKINVGVNLAHATQNYYAPSTSARGLLVGGYGGVGNKDYISTSTEFTLNYKKQFGDAHALEILGGYTTEHTEVEYATAGASGFSNEALTYHSLQSAETRDTPTSGGITANINSFLGRVNYTLLGRYNLTATFRADGSSRFPKGNKWGYFPSVGLSWNIDEEGFFVKNSLLPSAKLRISAGQVGNQEIGDYLFARLYTPRNYSFGNKIAIGYTATNYGNDELKWETTTQYNVGLDLGLLNNKLNITIDAYHKETSDLLVNLPVESTTGLRDKTINIGNISNRGVEFSADAVIVENRSLKWTALANIAKNINRIGKLGTDEFSVGETLVKEGEALGTFFGYDFAGVVQQGEESSVPVPAWVGTATAGDAKYVDHGGDPNTIDDDDRIPLGSIQPDFTYGFASRIQYKKLDASVTFQGSQGNYLYNSLRHSLETPSRTFNGSAELANRWTPANTNTDVPRAVPVPYTILDSRFIEDASYLRLKDITVGYNFKLRYSKAAKLSARVYVSGQNLLTFTKYKGYDPEASRNGSDETNGLQQGIDDGAYPAARTFIGGFSITF
ncbi:MAG: TonB-dependent receptor [Mediterranea sp.]|jgi:TonB-linked SusC/RagA family outer membrane protein|nr:TonB-dependent receptor [Mediterranea sp.]